MRVKFVFISLVFFSCKNLSNGIVPFFSDLHNINSQQTIENQYHQEIRNLVHSLNRDSGSCLSSRAICQKLDYYQWLTGKTYRKVKRYPDFLFYFVNAYSVVFPKDSSLHSVALDAFAVDKIRSKKYKIFEKKTNVYLLCPFRFKASDLEVDTLTGKLYKKGSLLADQGLMYVVDSSDSIYLAKDTGDANYPHPTLIGSENPQVKCSGTIFFSNSKIIKLSNSSGHFKVGMPFLEKALKLFKAKFPNSFHEDFTLVDKYSKRRV